MAQTSMMAQSMEVDECSDLAPLDRCTGMMFTLRMLVNFLCFCCLLLSFFKINFFKRFFQEHYQSVNCRS